MDEWLANIYGTGGAEDIEKTAQHHLLQKLAAEEGIDLSGLSDEDIANLAAEVLGNQAEQVQEEEEVQAVPNGYEAAAQEQLLAKEAQAKFEEADFLGRVMAHAFSQEMDKIASAKEKTAAKKAPPKAVKGKPFAKKASAFDKLAEMRAGEMLSAVGIDPSTGAPFEGGEQAGSSQPQSPQQAQQPQRPGMVSGQQGATAFNRAAQMSRPQAQGAQQGQVQQGNLGQQAQTSPQAQMFAEQQRQQQLAQAQAQQQQQLSIAPNAQQAAGPEGVAPQGGEQEAEFENAVNHRALEMLASLGYDPEEILQALAGGAQGGQEHRAQ